jgi:hypothetical protein
LVNMFTKYNPTRLDFIDTILEQYAGREDVLIESLVLKYGPEPGRESVPLAVAAVSLPTAAYMPASEHKQPEKKKTPLVADATSDTPPVASTPPTPTPVSVPPVETKKEPPLVSTPPAAVPEQAEAAPLAPTVPMEHVSPAPEPVQVEQPVHPPISSPPQVTQPEPSPQEPAPPVEPDVTETPPRPETRKFMGDTGMEALTVDDLETFQKPSDTAEIEAFTQDVASPEKVRTPVQPDLESPPTSDTHPRALLWWQDRRTVHLTFNPQDCLAIDLVSPDVLRVACVPHYDTKLKLFADVTKADLSTSGKGEVTLWKADVTRNWMQLISTANKEQYFAMDWIRRDQRDDDDSSDEDDK